MPRNKIALKRFLAAHPTCCFCGGSAPATTQDHVPARSFFRDRRHPAGLEFPACASCQERTSDAEDVARLVALRQGAAFNPEVREYVEENHRSINRGLAERRPGMKFIAYAPDGREIHVLSPKVQKALIEAQRKLALALYYRLTGAILGPERCVALTFYPVSDGRRVAEYWRTLDQKPPDQSMHDPSVAEQFKYRYRRVSPERLGFDLLVGTFLHGFVAFMAYYLSVDHVHDEAMDIVVTPYEPPPVREAAPTG